MVKEFGIEYKGVACGKFRRYFSFKNFVDFFKVPIGIFQSLREIKKFRADVVFSKGGFVALPVVLASALLKVPVIIHESDVVPGLANKIAGRFSTKICISFEETKKYLSKFEKKIVVTGNPIRKFLADGNHEKGFNLTGLNKDKPIILVIGGSQGARQINTLVRNSLHQLLQKFQIIHLTGDGNVDSSINKKGYVQYDYLDKELPDVFAICDLVISRGGANTLSEIAFLKKKALIIPLGTNVSRGDQVENAELFSQKFCWEVLTGQISEEDFTKKIDSAYKSSFKDSDNFSDSAEKIAKIILKMKR